ncbi:MAG: PQQ-binding-like beta-propeller repeat protein [bacterium]|nr:PQQ-binding-like beta-propeller repeat protein [bacterium]
MNQRKNNPVEIKRLTWFSQRLVWSVFCVLGMAAVPCEAEDWPEYHGPNRDRISSETGWMTSWEGEGPQALWRARLGPGYSSFAVVDGKAYTMGYDVKNGEDNVFCFNAADGTEIWKKAYKCERINNMHEGGPGATPTVNDGKVYTMSKEAHFRCYNAEDGELIWAKDLKAEIGAKTPTWGFAGSPLVLGDVIFVDVGVIAAFNKTSGELIWKTKDYNAGYGTQVAFELNGETCIANIDGFGLVVVKAKDGAEVCTYRWDTNYDINAATPLIDGDRIFISSGYNKGCAMVKIGPDGKTETLWSNKRMRNHFNASVLWKGHLYGFDEDELVCLDAETGEENWRQSGLGKGSLIIASGEMVILGGRGELVIAPADPSGFKASGRQQILGGTCWTCPVLVDGRLYARNAKGDMICLNMKSN